MAQSLLCIANCFLGKLFLYFEVVREDLARFLVTNQDEMGDLTKEVNGGEHPARVSEQVKDSVDLTFLDQFNVSKL